MLLAQTRRTVWEETYRGIYPDEKIDGYNAGRYALRDKKLIESSEHQYYLFMDGNCCAGYFSFGAPNYGPYKDFRLCLNNLYIRREYQGMGLGKQAFACIQTYCADQGIGKFYCGCNVHNIPARKFYLHMGGIPGAESSGHADQSDDIIHYEFHIGENK